MLSALLMSRQANFYLVEKGRNKGIVIVLGFWPERILKHRGWKNRIYQRLLTSSEIEQVQNSRRGIAWHYKDLSLLLADEINVLGNSEEFISEANFLCAHLKTSIDAINDNWQNDY